MTLEPNKAYVVRNLSYDARSPNGARIPPRVAQLVRLIGDQAVIRLRIGAVNRWHTRTRSTSIENFAREATPREVTVGMPIGPL